MRKQKSLRWRGWEFLFTTGGGGGLGVHWLSRWWEGIVLYLPGLIIDIVPPLPAHIQAALDLRAAKQKYS